MRRSRAAELGIGSRLDADALSCSLLDAGGNVIETGCQQFARRGAWTYPVRVATSWTLALGTHTIQAALLRSASASAPVTINVRR